MTQSLTVEAKNVQRVCKAIKAQKKQYKRNTNSRDNIQPSRTSTSCKLVLRIKKWIRNQEIETKMIETEFDWIT